MAQGKIKKIGLITSGGDCSGMNSAIRSIVRYALYHNIEPIGFYRGYKGLIQNDAVTLSRRSVSNIIGSGGTILKTTRCPEFETKEGQKKAVQNIKKNKIDAMIIIGGDGSFRGAHKLNQDWQIPSIGIPATIDNDIKGTDSTIGSYTAVNVALGAIDKIRDTASSLERIFIVEVMGRTRGYIAMLVGLAGGAEDVILPELDFSLDRMCNDIKKGREKGKLSWIIVVAEGAASARNIGDEITKKTGFETREVVLGHIQRGGNPTAFDRILAARFGAYAVDLLIKGKMDKAVVIKADELTSVDLTYSTEPSQTINTKLYDLMKILAQ
jgi:6-phosphofructokinase 1